MENGPGLKMYFLSKMGIFHCYVSLPEGKFFFRGLPHFFQVNLPCFTWFHVPWALPCSCPYARGTRGGWAGVDLRFEDAGKFSQKRGWKHACSFFRKKGVMLRSAIATLSCVLQCFCLVKSDIQTCWKTCFCIFLATKQTDHVVGDPC